MVDEVVEEEAGLVAAAEEIALRAGWCPVSCTALGVDHALIYSWRLDIFGMLHGTRSFGKRTKKSW